MGGTEDIGDIRTLQQDLILFNTGCLGFQDGEVTELPSGKGNGMRWMLGTSYFLPAQHRTALSMDFYAAQMHARGPSGQPAVLRPPVVEVAREAQLVGGRGDVQWL